MDATPTRRLTPLRPHGAAPPPRGRARRVVSGAGVAAGALGALFLVAWIAGEAGAMWASPLMKTNTALCLVLLGAALAPRASAARRPALDRVSVTCAVAALLVAGATLLEYVLVVDLGIDQLLARDPDPVRETAGHPNRMAPNAALAIVGVGAALLAARAQARGRLAQAFAVLVLGICTLAVVGYLYDVPVLYRPTEFVRISPYAAVGIAVVALGVLALRTDVGIARLMADDGAAGLLARPMVVVAFVVPTALGWIRLEAERAGLLPGAAGTSLLVLVMIAALVGVVLALARSLAALDARRREAQEDLARVARLDEALARAASVVDVAEATLGAGLDAFGAKAGVLVRRVEEGERLEVVATRGMDADVVASYATFPLTAPVPLARAARESEPVFVPDPEALRAAFAIPAEHLRPHEHGAWAALPLEGSDGPVGVLGLSFAEPQTFEGDVRARLVRLASRCEQALDRAMTLERLEETTARLHRALDAAERAGRAKDEFLAMLGHELRNPLAPIRTALDLMRLRADGADARERAVIERQVSHMLRLVDDLLDVSRVTRGKIELHRAPVEIAAVVTKALEIAAPLFEERRQQVTVRVPPRGLAVFVDEHRMTQVVANLLTNAAKYGALDGRVDVEARADGDQVELAVRDDGRGIEPELLPRVFELFVQGERSIDRRDGGLGLGLAIAHTLVRMHGGTIAASSAGVGRGATFTLRLPQAVQHATAPALERGPEPKVAPRGAGRRVLVVDDNRDAAEMLGEVLRRAGHDVVVAFDGPSALAHAAHAAPDVAFLDIGLPLMDGYEVARRLREAEDTRRSVLVAVTGYGLESDRARSSEAGFDHHLVKPVAADQTLAIVAASPPPA